MEHAVVAVEGGADRVLASALSELDAVFDEIRGHVLVVGGVMARLWLHLRPLGDFEPRATADVDIGIDKLGLRLTATSRRIVPLLRGIGYEPMAVEETFRFEKEHEAGLAIVDLLVAKGMSRDEPPVLEEGVTTLAAPGLLYAQQRRAVDVRVTFADGDDATVVQVPLPTLDAAFVLKGALAASGVRRRADRVARDTVDGLMLAFACARDDQAVGALVEHLSNREVRRAIHWVQSSFVDPRTAAARRVGAHLAGDGFPDGEQWAVDAAAYFVEQLK
jgi:hypothetical protein